MAFGITRHELNEWKRRVAQGEVAFLTHYWLHPRHPEVKSVTKVGCADPEALANWGASYGMEREWIHFYSTFPHFDLFGGKQKEVLYKEKLWEHIRRFDIG